MYAVCTLLTTLQVRRLGAVHRYSIQCVLPINLFNEKIYSFLWFWMVFVAVVTCISTLSWFLRITVDKDRHQYIRRYVNLAIKLTVRYDGTKRQKLAGSLIYRTEARRKNCEKELKPKNIAKKLRSMQAVAVLRAKESTLGRICETDRL